MSGTAAQRDALTERVVAPATALAMLAVQVGANATRDALFLSSFPVTDLPWFVAASATVTFGVARATGALLERHGPRRLVPAGFALGGALFVTEAWLLTARPAAAAVVLYFHATVLGAIVTSMFWSLLNERFDPHVARGLFSRVAGAATLGAVLGGTGVAVLAQQRTVGVVLAVLATGAAACAGGASLLGHGGDSSPLGPRHSGIQGDSTEPSRTPYVRRLAVLATLAALVGTLCDYLLKADVVAYVAEGAGLVRFFGLFYAATGIAAFAIQALCAPTVLGRLGIAGALAVHPLAVGLGSLAAFAVPSPWRGLLTRGADATLRRSLFRTGYELLYTPLPDQTRRRVKTTIDVGWDCVGSFAGSGIVLLVTRWLPTRDIVALTAACLIGAGLQLAATRRLPSGYLRALEEKLRRRGQPLPRVTHYSYSHLTIPQVVADPWPDHRGSTPVSSADPAVEALAALRSGDPRRIGPALRIAETETALVGAVIPLLGDKQLFHDAGRALQAHGTRVAGQLVDALVEPSTPEEVRSRLPLVLETCVSRRARDGLIEGLCDPSVKVRHRCCRALLEMTARDAALRVPRQVAYEAVDRELAEAWCGQASWALVFDLLALVHDREMMGVAHRACESGDPQAQGTALAYLESTLPRALFARVEQRRLSSAAQAR